MWSMIKRVGVLALCVSLLLSARCYWYQLYSLYICSVTLNKELRAKARYMLEKERESERQRPLHAHVSFV